MKKIIVGLMLVSTVASAQEVYVVSVQPRMVTMQQQRCEQVSVPNEDHSTAGTIIGGVAGGIIGNQVGGGNGKTIATTIGAVVGAMTGNNLGQQNTSSVRNRQICTYIPITVQQGEIVTFGYKGRIFTQTFVN